MKLRYLYEYISLAFAVSMMLHTAILICAPFGFAEKMDHYSRKIELFAKNKIEDTDQLNNI